MKKRAPGILRATLWSSLAVGLFLTPPARGSSLVSVSYSGTITQATNVPGGVVVGDRITGTFVYDYSQSGSTASGVANYDFTGSSKTHTLAFQIYPTTGPEDSSTLLFSDRYTGNASLATGGYYNARVTYNSTASGGTLLSLQGDSYYKYNTLGQDFNNTGSPTYVLTLVNASNAGGYTSTNLPLPNTTLMADFAKTNGMLTWDPDGSSFTADFTDVHLTSIPEPSSLLLAILGSLTVAAGGAIARRARAGVRKA
jgi:hypothetical protein